MRNAEIRSGDIRSAEVRVLETRAREARPTRRAVGPVYLADGHSAFCMPWLVLVRKPYAPVMATLCAVWFLTAWSYWGLVTYCNLFFLELGVNVNLVTMLNYAVQLPLHVVAFHLMRVTWGGRRSALKVLSVFGALVCAALAFTVGLGMKTVWVLSALAIVTMAIGTALWGPLISYSSERFPTELRGTAIGVFSAFTGLSTLATSYVGSVSFNSRSIWLLPLFWGVARCGVYLAVQQLDFDIRENELSDERSHCYF
ncbi:major facilitator family transporter [Gregarina niphandrodes]|uniref:Major facilitator family transporter n=1 Tax=Gregarina niphandrodes TaxID=110365 RepID=A0A023B7F3_GRENI|nr:major facilitator family transporter [Gregarina niphandrodes]EZG67248.1 major facilitator family transporter [Gregarina niphandrodes]|eukprot:XP_011130293.1 major facilitator family transporter [Gregarina niphandrodes]